VESAKTIQMKMPAEWLEVASEESHLLFGGNRSEMVRFAVLVLRHIRLQNPTEIIRLRSELLGPSLTESEKAA
jgi:hypothetical protein